ncbi:MAG: DUF945 domain-containing protein [Planctomycetes bacterium]|nr:DUF945 domain-containing protein [Planctomycetota bacterium]
MAHNLATARGKTSFAYYGEAPWHKLGTQLDAPATAAEAMTAATLDYEVTLTPMTISNGTAVPRSRAVVRGDNGAVLGVVSDRYVPVQNTQAFGFLDDIVADGGLRYHTAGALGRGERIFLLAKLPGHIQVAGSEDVVDKFLLLSNAHDGSAALRVLFTPVRVVCQNTLSIALSRGANAGISIRHNGDVRSKIEEARRVLGLADRFYEATGERINRLASSSPTGVQLERYYETLIPDPPGEADNARAKAVRDELHRLYEEGIGHDAPGVQYTMWSMYNAVTELADHRMSRGKTDADRACNRLRSVWWGTAARLKERAWNLALEMAA